MVRRLTAKAFRDFWKIRGRVATMILTLACGVGIFAGIEMAIATAFHTRDVLHTRMRSADLEVQFLPEDAFNLPDLTAIPGVHSVERRLVLPGQVLLDGNQRITGMLVFLETLTPTINVLEVLKGQPIRAEDLQSSVIERSLAQYHGFDVGDRMRVTVGAKTYETRVDGIVISPEYLITTTNPDYLVPEKGALGVVFAQLGQVSDALGFTMVNDLLFRFEPGADPDAVKQAVLERLGRLNLEHVIPRTQHFIWRYLELDMNAFRIYAPSIVLTLGTLALILTLITVNRLVLDQRRDIGVLLALGYGGRRIARAYADVGAVIGAVGGLLGTGLAFGFRNVFAGFYAQAIGVPYAIYVVDPVLLGLGFVVSVVLSATGTALPVLWLLRLKPQAIIREPVADALVLRAPRWRVFRSLTVLPNPVRFGVRNMVRRPLRTLSTVLAIAASLGVSIGYVASVTSNFHTIESVFERERWDFAVDFLYPVFLEDLAPLRALPNVRRVEPYFRRFAEVATNGRVEGAQLLGIDPTSGMKTTILKAGRFLSDAPDELLLSQDLAKRLGVEVGDPVTVRIRAGQEFPFRVAGISGEIVRSQVIMSFRRAQIITSFPDEGTGAFVEAAGPAAPLVTALSSPEYVARVIRKDQVAGSFRHLMSGMMRLVYVATTVSVFVATLFILTGVNLIISERQAEYATLKCLGYGRGRLLTIILAEALGGALLAALASIPIGMALALFLSSRMSEAWFEVVPIFPVGDFAEVLLTAIVLVPIAVYPGFRMVERLQITSALRTRLIE